MSLEAKWRGVHIPDDVASGIRYTCVRQVNIATASAQCRLRGYALSDLLLDVRVTDAETGAVDVVAESTKVDAKGNVVFDRRGGVLLSPVHLLRWVHAPEQLYRKTVHVDVMAIEPLGMSGMKVRHESSRPC